VLPLLEFAVTELGHRREDGRLTHHVYEQIGGVIGGLTRWCDQAYQTLPAAQQPLVRRIVTSLVRPGDEATHIPPTRQRRTLDQLRTETAETKGSEVEAVVAALADRRLLITSRDPISGEPVIELVHEALIREWGLLRQWLSEDHEFLVWREDLEADYTHWTASTAEHAGHDPELLLRGSALEQAQILQSNNCELLINVLEPVVITYRGVVGIHQPRVFGCQGRLICCRCGVMVHCQSSIPGLPCWRHHR
jgi:hypothetical protein